jgi:hypothetical protein
LLLMSMLTLAPMLVPLSMLLQAPVVLQVFLQLLALLLLASLLLPMSFLLLPPMLLQVFLLLLFPYCYLRPCSWPIPCCCWHLCCCRCFCCCCPPCCWRPCIMCPCCCLLFPCPCWESLPVPGARDLFRHGGMYCKRSHSRDMKTFSPWRL